MKPIDIIKGVNAQTDPVKQAAFFRKAWDTDCDEFFVGLDLATNPAIQYGLAVVPAIDEEDDGDPGTLTFEHFHKVALNIASGELSAPQTRKLLEECALSANVSEWNLWYRRILLKNLHLHLPMQVLQSVLIQLTKDDSVLPDTDK